MYFGGFEHIEEHVLTTKENDAPSEEVIKPG
jgi:hypothetical protein